MSHECIKTEFGCAHDNVKFCPCCKKVYCAFCGKEWPEKEIEYIERPFYPAWPWPRQSPYQPYFTWQYGNTSGSSGNADISNTDGEQYKMDVPAQPGVSVYCNHGK